MPKVFEFKINNKVRFRALLNNHRCWSNGSTGARCKLHSIIGTPYCWIHLKYKKHLRIKNSTIANAGKGLFAYDKKKDQQGRPVFKKGKRIITYFGEEISHRELNKRYGTKTAPYAVTNGSNDVVIDAALERGAGALANQAQDYDDNNAVLDTIPHPVDPVNRDDWVILKATEDIYHDDEIFVPYSRKNEKKKDKYVLNEPGVSFTTKDVTTKQAEKITTFFGSDAGEKRSNVKQKNKKKVTKSITKTAYNRNQQQERGFQGTWLQR